MGEERSGNNMILGMVGTMNHPLGNLGRCKGVIPSLLFILLGRSFNSVAT